VVYDEVARAESVRGELVLRRRRDRDGHRRGWPDGDHGDGAGVLELRANGMFVMDSAEHSSERALADAALALVERPRSVLVGGLGLGFTLAGVLDDRRVERCDVVEIEPALVEWMRDGTIPQGRQLLEDRRVRVVVADLATVVHQARPSSYDVVLLDVDNGPAQLVHQTNSALYEPPFLELVRETLTPGGALAVWSAGRASPLLRDLEAIFGSAEEQALDVRLQDRDERYWLYAARRAGVASEA
jgi:spermidine synthase